MITEREDVSRNRICFVSIPSADSLVWLLIFKAVIKESILSVCSPRAVLCCLIHRSLSCCRICFETLAQVHNLRSEQKHLHECMHDLKSVTEGYSHMEEIPLLLGNICAICYESALKEYLQKRWTSCRIRRVLSCCCSRHLMAESANAFKKIVMRSCRSTPRKGGGERKNKEWRQQDSRETRYVIKNVISANCFLSIWEELHTTP